MRHHPPRVARATLRAEVDHGVAELVGDPDRPRGWTLLVDGTAQSHVDLDDPTHLEFEYVRRLGPRDGRDRAGRGAAARRCTSAAAPGHCPATWPTPGRGPQQRVVELDGALAELVAAWLPADGLGHRGGGRRRPRGAHPNPARFARPAGARRVRRRPDPAAPDLGRVPAVRGRWCWARGGVYAANLADGGRLEFARAQVAAAAAVLPEVALVVAPDVLHGRRFGNLVLVAGYRALPVPSWCGGCPPIRSRPGCWPGTRWTGSSAPRSRRPTGRPRRPRCRRRGSSASLARHHRPAEGTLGELRPALPVDHGQMTAPATHPDGGGGSG